MSWFDKPKELFRSDKILSFWPNENQSASERINASTRFILYLACALYIIKRDIRIIALAILAVAAHGSACEKAGSEPCSGELKWNGKEIIIDNYKSH